MGKQRAGVVKNCKACTVEFYVARYRMDTANFCSLNCQNHKQYDRFTFNCEQCGKFTEASPSRRKMKKKFCSLECRTACRIDTKQRRQRQKASAVLKRGYNGSRQTRKYLFKIKDKVCEICGYNEYDFCLDIHHIDENPNNNTLENLAILCAFCHKKLHKGVVKLGV